MSPYRTTHASPQAHGLSPWVRPALTLLLTLCLTVTLAAATGCVKREVKRRGYPGFSVETGAAPPPTGTTHGSIRGEDDRDR